MADGIYSNTELMDSVIVDLNDTLKEFMSGQYIQGCCRIAQMSQKLVNLRKTVDNDLKERDKYIKRLITMLNDAGVDYKEIPVEDFIKSVDSKG